MSSSPNSSSSSDAASVVGGSMAWLMDVPCRLEFVLGSCAVSVRDCLQFERNTVITLTEMAGADLEVRVEGVPIAMGEVVVVDDRTGLRVSQILPPAARENA